MSYELNIKINTKVSRNVVGVMKEDLQKALLSAETFEDLRNIWKENKNYFKDIQDVSLWPDNIRTRCDLMAVVKAGKADSIKVVPKLRGCFIKIEVNI